MSSDLAGVRADVKEWERSFRDTNGRNPTINDIKQQPAVAQKYKLYKKLSKAPTTASSSISEANGPPSTPPRQTSSTPDLPPRLLLSASRFVKTTAPLASYNPFSPQKKDKGKQRESILFNLTKLTSNPFASPRKPKPQTLERHPSPDPFPLIPPTQPSTSTCLPPELPSTISRARKRLRGEPVSPTPNKEKRRRVLSPASLPLTKLQLQTPGSDRDDGEDDGEDNDPDGGDSSFVDDSPMKPAANGKAFTFLFEETIKSTFTSELFSSNAPTVQSQADGKQSKTKFPDVDKDIFSDGSRSKKTVKTPSIMTGPFVKSQSSTLTKSRAKPIQSTLSFTSNPLNGARKRSPSQTHTSTKRVLSDTEHVQDDMAIDDTKVVPPFEDPSTPATQLLPPSPKPNASRPSGKSKRNGARSSQPSRGTSHKKFSLQDNDHGITQDMENDDGSNSDDLNMHHSVKLVHHSRGIRAALATEESNSEIEDPILNCAKRIQPRGQGSVPPAKQGDNNGTDIIRDEDNDEDAEVNVDGEELEFSNELRHVLVLESLKSKQNEHEEERIVKGLLSGQRVLHYNPKKGGEIWGVGENERDEFAEDEERGLDEVTDEWEGDPVPWEVGELSESHYHLEEL